MNYKLILLLIFALIPAYFINNFFVLYLSLVVIILYFRWTDVARLQEIELMKKEQSNIKISHAVFTEKLTPFMQGTNREIKTLTKKIATMEKMIIAQNHRKGTNVDIEQLKRKFTNKAQMEEARKAQMEMPRKTNKSNDEQD